MIVKVPSDLKNIKTKVIFNLTRRQLICFAIAGAVGAVVFFLTRGFLETNTAIVVMAIFMVPIVIGGVYEKNGKTLEKILFDVIRTKSAPAKRPYASENLYRRLQEEAGSGHIERNVKRGSSKDKKGN